MGDRSPPRQVQVHHQQQRPSHLQEPTWKLTGGRHTDQQHQGPSASKILAVVTLVPVGGTLLGLSGLTLAATLFGLAVSTPVFLLFSPVIVPAAVAICLAIAAFMTSGVFGLTALSSLSWVYRYIRGATGTVPEQMDMAKRRMQEMAGYVGQKTKEAGQEVQSRAQEGRRSTTEQRT
ncbi:oleosin 18.2 kDa-like [Cucurbita maxima]|uniref:Oleosin n=1 Tax=Cucurbita maxima TaxID=3661 RepID=A0A6J1JXL3_CUCMA|nr:oleosin 18.2 kDa-like [Cucurbita maxima]